MTSMKNGGLKSNIKMTLPLAGMGFLFVKKVVEWKTEFNARTSAERSNKREKYDFLLENGRHRSSKMWYCRLYHIMMLQLLDAWDLPFESTLRKLILKVHNPIITIHLF